MAYSCRAASSKVFFVGRTNIEAAGTSLTTSPRVDYDTVMTTPATVSGLASVIQARQLRSLDGVWVWELAGFLLNTPRNLQHFCSFTRFATRPPPRDRETRASHPPDLAAPPHKLDDIHDCRPFLGPPWSWRGRGTDGPRVGLLGGQTHDGPLPLSMSGDVRFSIQVAVSARSSVIRNFATDLSCTIGQQTYGGGTR